MTLSTNEVLAKFTNGTATKSQVRMYEYWKKRVGHGEEADKLAHLLGYYAYADESEYRALKRENRLTTE